MSHSVKGNNGSFTYSYVMAVVGILIVWNPLQRWILQIDGAGISPFLLVLSALFLIRRQLRKNLLKKHVIIYFILMIYMFANAYVKHSYFSAYTKGNPEWLMFYNLFISPMVMLLVMYLCSRNVDRSLKFFLFAILCYCVLALFFAGSEEHEGRLGGGINSNEIALTGSIGFCVALLHVVRKQLSYIALFFFAAIPAATVFASGSRMGFGIIFIAFTLTTLTIVRKGKKMAVLGKLLGICVLGFIVFYALSNTLLGERLAHTSEDTEGMMLATGTILDLFGDRGLQYYFSWPYFVDNLATGIGFQKWRELFINDLCFHSEWLVQYCEGGLIAFALYLVFFFGTIHSIKNTKLYKNEEIRRTRNTLLSVMCAIAFANFVLWTYNSVPIFVIYALCNSYPIYLKIERHA